MIAEPGVHDTLVPLQIHQLATTLYNVLIQDPDFNAPVLEKLHNDPASGTHPDLSAWSAEDMAHLASHLAITATSLAQAAQRRPGAVGRMRTTTTCEYVALQLSPSLIFDSLGPS